MVLFVAAAVVVAIVAVVVVVESPFADQDEFAAVESDPLARDAEFDLAEEAVEVVVASSSAVVVALDFVVAVGPSCEVAVAFASAVVAEPLAGQAEAVVVFHPAEALVTDQARPELPLELGEPSVSCSCDR